MSAIKSQMQYSRISTEEATSLLKDDSHNTDDEDLQDDDNRVPSTLISDAEVESLRPTAAEVGSAPRSHTMVIGNDTPSPFSRRPSKARDFIYAVLFFVHLLLVSALTGTEDLELQDSFTIWSAAIMIVIVSGSCFGIGAVIVLSNESSREIILSHCVPLSIAFELCLGNILILTNTRYSLIGLFFVGGALIDSFSFKAARDNLSFTIALLDMATEICKPYGLSLTITCWAILAAQTGLLMWWGVLLIGLIMDPPSRTSDFLVVLMLLSLFWIVNFFEALMSYTVGGCVLWHFLKDSASGPGSVVGTGVGSASYPTPGSRVLLHLHCALTSSLGSICKGAAFSPLADAIISIDQWAKGRGMYVTQRSARGIVGYLIEPFTPFAKKTHRLALCLSATYGRTLSKASGDLIKEHPEILEILSEDTTCYILSCTGKEIASLASLLGCLGLLLERTNGSYFSLFLVVSFLLVLSGIRLALNVYKSACDAIIVAFFLQPERLRLENQIVYLRFLRRSEMALR